MSKSKSKPVLKCEKKTVIQVNSCDIDRFIKAALGQDYNFAYREELASDSAQEYSIGGGQSADDLAEIKQQIDDDIDSLSGEEILEYLAGAGLIEAGDYVVSFND